MVPRMVGLLTEGVAMAASGGLIAPRCRRRTSLHRLAAVDDHRVPDDEGSRVRTQPQDSLGDLLRLSHPSDGLLRDHPLASFRRVTGDPVHHAGVDDPGADGIYADVGRCIVEGRRPGQADHAVLRGDVRGSTSEALDPGARGGVHDRAAPLLEHQGDLVLHAKKDAAKVGVQDPVPLLLRDLRGGLRLLFDPALLKATSRRPNESTVLSRAAFTFSLRVTPHATASARPPDSSIMRAVSWLPCSEASAATTLVPSRANASAVARPMPLPAPVTNATFPA